MDDDRDLLRFCRKCIYVNARIKRFRSGNAYFVLSCTKNISPIIKFEGGECDFIQDKLWDKRVYNTYRYNKFLSPNKYGDLKNQKMEEKKKMVERVKPEFTPIKSFDGVIERIDVTEGKYENEAGEKPAQYSMVLKPIDKATIDIIKDSKTQRLYNWIRISEGSQNGKIAEGSTLDKFIQECEAVMPECEKFKTHKEVMDYITGKSFHFVRKRLGKSFKGHEGKEIFCPQALIK